MAPAVVASTTEDYWTPRPTTTSSTKTTLTTCTTSTSSPHQTTTSTDSGHRRRTSAGPRSTATGNPSHNTSTSARQSDGNASTSSTAGIHASPTPSGKPHSPPLARNGRGFHLTLADRKAVIACSVIGGVFVLALLVFLIWQRRRRKHTAHPYLVAEDSQSTTTFLTTKTRDAKLTALPMHRDRRKAASGNLINDSLSSARPVGQNLWKTANPPTPSRPGFFSSNIRKTSLNPVLLQPPEMAVVAGSSRLLRPAIRISSHDEEFYTPAESIHAPSTIDLEAKSYSQNSSGQSGSQPRRWSIVASFASARSRLSASTMANLPRVKGLKDWMGGQNDQPQRLEEGQPGPSSFRGVLKNKATKPNLAPVPTRQLSRQQFSGAGTGMSSQQSDGEGGGDAIPDDGVIS